MEKLRRNASSWNEIYNIIHDKVHFAWKNTYIFFYISPAECELFAFRHKHAGAQSDVECRALPAH